MISYFEESEHILERVWLDYLGGRYEGRGILTWKVEAGFHLEAFLERRGTAVPNRIEMRRFGLIPSHSIRMKPAGYEWAMAPNVPLVDRLDLLDEKRLSVDLNQVIWSRYFRSHNEYPNWDCRALYETDSGLLWPDSVDTEISIKGNRIYRAKSLSAIWYEDEARKVWGRLIDDEHMDLYWSLRKSLWRRDHVWRSPEAVRVALSILLGRDIDMLQCEIVRQNHQYVEIRKKTGVHLLGHLLSPLGNDRLRKEIFIRLMEFLARDEKGAATCRNIFSQIVAASMQHTWQGRELLVATILEATLRTVYQQPFKSKGPKWHLKKAVLDQFRRDYLSDEWEPACKVALRVHHRLRGRNAHPDWLTGEGGALSDAELNESLDAMVFLSRFYGYMILALAGFRDIKPQFPKPHNESQAPIVRSSGDGG